MRSHLESWGQFCAPRERWSMSREGDGAEEGPGAPGGAGRAQPGEMEAQVGPSGSAQFPDRRGHPGGGQALLPGNRDRTKGNGLKLHQESCGTSQEGFRLNIKEHFFMDRTAALASAVWGSAGVAIPGGI